MRFQRHASGLTHPHHTPIQHNYRPRGFARTHLYVYDFALLLGFLFIERGMENNNKTHIFFYLLHNRISNFTRVCVLIVTQFGIMIWTKWKFWDILLCFPVSDCGKRKPTWRSPVWWLANWLNMTSHENPITAVSPVVKLTCLKIRGSHPFIWWMHI